MSLSIAATKEICRGGWDQGIENTHQVFIGRLYFFVGSVGINTQNATTSSPLRGSGIILNSHRLRGRGARECSEEKL